MYRYFRARGNGRKLRWGRLRWEIRKRSFPRRGSQLQACLISRSIQTTLSGTGWDFWGVCAGQELDSMILMGPSNSAQSLIL